MRLVVNNFAAQKSSFGVRRYTDSIVSRLKWPEGIEISNRARYSKFGRLGEFLEPSDKNAILWTPCQRGSIRASHHVVTVHDCISFEYIYKDDFKLPLYLGAMNGLLDRAEAVVAISFATRDAILRNFSLPASRITVIQSGMESIQIQQETDKPNLNQPFVLLVTNTLPHKNTVAACAAWARSKGPCSGVLLRVIGKIPEEALDACRNIPIVIENGVSDNSLAHAYRNCLFLLAPSLSEGHNLPVAEALVLGAEALCSDIPVHREFYEGKVRFFNPLIEEAIVEALNSALATSRPWFVRGADKQRTFDDVARDYVALFQSI